MKRMLSVVAMTLMALSLVACTYDVPPAEQGSGNNSADQMIIR
jgi:hypothetical protein